MEYEFEREEVHLLFPEIKTIEDEEDLLEEWSTFLAEIEEEIKCLSQRN